MSQGPSQLSPESSFGNFDLVKQHKLGFIDVSVSKWRSRVSGLTVVHLDYEGRLCHIAFAVDEYPPCLVQLPSSKHISWFQRKVCNVTHGRIVNSCLIV